LIDACDLPTLRLVLNLLLLVLLAGGSSSSSDSLKDSPPNNCMDGLSIRQLAATTTRQTMMANTIMVNWPVWPMRVIWWEEEEEGGGGKG